ncbi:hypothetical protein P4U07_30970 [Bacillus mycoides]|uniref:hypothetical protein n=1 Tax=Bacillus mycoides TaxID=1405 RepID=UPI002E2503DD|nr:hypothetical protein [Bacillus mycoides]
MFKKLVVGALVTGFALTGGMGTISASAEKDYSIKSFDYVTVDGKNVDSRAKLNNNSNEEVKITMVLPKKNTNGDWLAYGFTSRESLEKFIKKDKQRLKNEIKPLGSGGSGPGSTDFYDKGGQYFSWGYGFKNLPSSWNDRISVVSTASPSASYSTTLWEQTSTQGYGKGVSFRHSDWYGIKANLADNTTSAIEIK